MNNVTEKRLIEQHIKSELLCYGARATHEAMTYINSINPYINNKGIHAASFYIGKKTYINMQLNERYNFHSPYLLQYNSNMLYITKNGRKICDINITPAPPWYKNETSNGVPMFNIFNIHGDNVLALSNYDGCYYAEKGAKCKFCSFMPCKSIYGDLAARIDDIVETLKCAYQYNSDYSIALSEGTKSGSDRGALFFSEISRAIITNLGNKKISVEIAPPSEIKYIDEMIQNGITSLIMNIEIYDEKTRKNICPGKSEIPLEHYMETLSYSVNKLGVGNVSSVLIAGIEPIQNTIACAKKLLNIGVIPTIIPFKPYDNCELRNNKVTQPYIIRTIQEEIQQEMIKTNFPNTISHACIQCGACNLMNKL